MLNNEMVTVSSGNFLPPAVKNSDPDSIASGKYDELGAFLNAHKDLAEYTYEDAKTLRLMCSNLQVSHAQLVMSLGRDGTYLHKKFPTMVADVPLPSRKARCYRTFTKREFRQLLERGGQAPTPVPPRDSAKKTARMVSSETARRIEQYNASVAQLSITIEGPGLSLKRAIASSADVARITALLEALTR